MPDLTNMPDSVEIGLQIALIAGAALIGFLVLRAAVAISVRHLIERRTTESAAGVLPPAELERRVNTIARLAIRVAATVIVAGVAVPALVTVVPAGGCLGQDLPDHKHRHVARGCDRAQRSALGPPGHDLVTQLLGQLPRALGAGPCVDQPRHPAGSGGTPPVVPRLLDHPERHRDITLSGRAGLDQLHRRQTSCRLVTSTPAPRHRTVQPHRPVAGLADGQPHPRGDRHRICR